MFHSAQQRQLLSAFSRRRKIDGLTFAELGRLAALKCSEDSISRKLRGFQKMEAREAEAFARALRVEVRFGREESLSDLLRDAGLREAERRLKRPGIATRHRQRLQMVARRAS